jgi:hypothetical protein
MNYKKIAPSVFVLGRTEFVEQFEEMEEKKEEVKEFVIPQDCGKLGCEVAHFKKVGKEEYEAYKKLHMDEMDEETKKGEEKVGKFIRATSEDYIEFASDPKNMTNYLDFMIQVMSMQTERDYYRRVRMEWFNLFYMLEDAHGKISLFDKLKYGLLKNELNSVYLIEDANNPFEKFLVKKYNL